MTEMELQSSSEEEMEDEENEVEEDEQEGDDAEDLDTDEEVCYISNIIISRYIKMSRVLENSETTKINV